jgi:molybdenum cofactor cytidylyltransferase
MEQGVNLSNTTPFTLCLSGDERPRVASASAITPIILAAGASTRMGRPKALLDFDGKCSLELVLEAVRGLGTPVVVLGAARDEIRKRVNLDSAIVAIHEGWQRGRTSSLKAGLSLLPSGASSFLLFPVDMPLVRAGEVGRPVEVFLRCEDASKAVFISAHGGRHGHPVLCRREIAHEFLALADDAPARAVTKADPRRIQYVEFDRPHVLMDADTPDEYAACLAAYRSWSMGRD